MQPHDGPFREETLDTQLDALARGDHAASDAPASQAYEQLSQLYAAQAWHEAQAIARVRGRLARHASAAPLGSASAASAARLTTREAPSALPPPLADSTRELPRAPRTRRVIWMRRVALALVVVMLVGGFAALRIGGAGSPATNSYYWKTIASPNTRQAVNELMGISMRSATDGWAWGISQDAPSNQNSNPISAPLVEHWDGKSWTVVPTPAMPYGGELADIVSLAPDNAWAVGSQLITPTSSQDTTGGAVIEHWDGKTWTMVPSNIRTLVSTDDTSLAQLAALSPTNIWAVGMYSGATNRGMIVHWDGQKWQEVTYPVVRPAGAATMQFTGITALAPNDIWIVGSGHGAHAASVIEHWDGAQWRSVAASAPPGGATLNSIAAVSANDVWVVGRTTPLIPFPSYSAPLIEHWDGQSWSVVSSPSASNAMLLSVAAVAPDDVWAVGTQGLGGDVEQQGRGLIEHWDGQQWSQVINPNPQGYTTLSGVVGDPAIVGKVWVVGATGPAQTSGDQPSDTRTLMEVGQP